MPMVSKMKIKPTVCVADWQAEIDRMSKELDLLDNKLQQSNWKTKRIESYFCLAAENRANVMQTAV